MTQGICYFLCGNWRKYLGPLVVSLYSLRHWYEGPVSLLLGDDIDLSSQEFPPTRGLCGKWPPLRLDAMSYCQVPLTSVRRHAHYVTKASLWRYSPYQQTVFLDSDTVVTGDITELFRGPLIVTRFANWMTTGNKIGGRLRQWSGRGIRSRDVETLLENPFPAINTGVVGWNRERAKLELEAWESLTKQGWQCSFTDELAMQILWPYCAEMDCRMLDDRFNCSPTFGVHRDDARIWHYHGRRMVPGRKKPEAAARYKPHLLAAIEGNIGGIADWLPEVDPGLWELVR